MDNIGPVPGAGSTQQPTSLGSRRLGALEVSTIGLGVQNMSRKYETTVPFRAEMINVIRAAFDHSWSLLTDAQREAFTRLSVFRGGFDREAAESVAGADLIVCNNVDLESDHLPLFAAVMRAVRSGASLMSVGSSPSPGDRLLASIVVDPMRGTTAALYAGLIRLLLETLSAGRSAAGADGLMADEPVSVQIAT